jgi:hypothetical protein
MNHRIANEVVVITGGTSGIGLPSAKAFAADGHVIKRSGKTFTTPIALRLEVQSGKIRRLQLYEDTLLIAQAFEAAAGAPSVGPDDVPESLSAGTSTRSETQREILAFTLTNIPASEEISS